MCWHWVLSTTTFKPGSCRGNCLNDWGSPGCHIRENLIWLLKQITRKDVTQLLTAGREQNYQVTKQNDTKTSINYLHPRN